MINFLSLSLLFLGLTLIGLSSATSPQDRSLFRWLTSVGVFLFALSLVIMLTGCTPY